MILRGTKNDIKGSVRILSFMKNDIKVFSAIYGDNWQSLNILTTGETFAQNIIVYLTFGSCKRGIFSWEPAL